MDSGVALEQLNKEYEALKESLQCPICLETFSKPVKILPCLHSFCFPCIHQHITSSSSSPFPSPLVVSEPSSSSSSSSSPFSTPTPLPASLFSGPPFPTPSSGSSFSAPSSGSPFSAPIPTFGSLSPFSAPTPATGSLFSAPAPTTGSPFSAPTPTAGSPLSASRSPFSAPTPATGSLFSAPAPTTGSPFSAPSPTFGSPSPLSAPASRSPFSAPSPTFGSLSPFSAPASRSPFSAPAPTFGSLSPFSAPASRSPFSAPTPATGSLSSAPSPTFGSLSPFSEPAPTTGSPFSAPSPTTGSPFSAPSPTTGSPFSTPAPTTGSLSPFSAPSSASRSPFSFPVAGSLSPFSSSSSLLPSFERFSISNAGGTHHYKQRDVKERTKDQIQAETEETDQFPTSHSCPICRRGFAVTKKNGVPILKDNLYFLSQLERLEELNTLIEKTMESVTSIQIFQCSLCLKKGKEVAEATHRCMDCKKDFCKKHTDLHLVFTTEHKIVLISEAPLSSASFLPINPRVPLQQQACPQHPSDKLTLFCTQCSIPVCSICLLCGGHKGHISKFVGGVADECKSQLNNLIKEVKERRGVIEESLSVIDSSEDIVCTMTSIQHDVIVSTFDNLKQKIEERKIELIRELHRRSNQKLEDLGKTRKQLDRDLECLDNSVSVSTSIVRNAGEYQIVCQTPILLDHLNRLKEDKSFVKSLGDTKQLELSMEEPINLTAFLSRSQIVEVETKPIPPPDIRASLTSSSNFQDNLLSVLPFHGDDSLEIQVNARRERAAGHDEDEEESSGDDFEGHFDEDYEEEEDEDDEEQQRFSKTLLEALFQAYGRSSGNGTLHDLVDNFRHTNPFGSNNTFGGFRDESADEEYEEYGYNEDYQDEFDDEDEE